MLKCLFVELNKSISVKFPIRIFTCKSVWVKSTKKNAMETKFYIFVNYFLRIIQSKFRCCHQSGNLIFRRTARNFNPAVIMAGKVSVVEVEEIVETGSFDPDSVHLPGIFVHRIVHNPTPEKRIEQRTVRQGDK